MEKKQTAVQYLVKEFSEILGLIKTTPMQDLLILDAVNKALSKERKQIEEAHIDGMEFIAVDPNKYKSDAEDYYTQTYNK